MNDDLNMMNTMDKNQYMKMHNKGVFDDIQNRSNVVSIEVNNQALNHGTADNFASMDSAETPAVLAPGFKGLLKFNAQNQLSSFDRKKNDKIYK